MKIITQTVMLMRVKLIGVFLGACLAAPAIAEDIEIYTSLGPAAQANPNLLFLIDTSGSMNTTSRVKERYDPSETYTGACVSTAIYFSDDGVAPDCATSTNYFDATANTCDHSVTGYDVDGNKITPGQDGSLLMIGTYSDQMAQYDPVSKTWRALSTTSAAERAYSVECRSDSGIHGSGTGTKKYIRDNVGWSSTAPADPNNPHPVWYNSANNVQLYSGNYMNYYADDGVDNGGNVPMDDVAYIDQVKSAVEIMVRGNTRVDIGLMRFDKGNEGGAVMYPITDVGADRNDFFTRLQNKIDADGSTPLSEAYYEALLYFGGKKIDYGNSANPSNQTGTKESGNPSNYQTPITATCDSNYIVLLSDGSPTRDYLNATRRAALPEFAANYSCNTAPDDGDPLNDIVDNCLPKLAAWAYNYDVATRAGIAAHEGTQRIVTHTIGFGDIAADAEDLLRQTAKAAGEGNYYLAEDEADLIAAFDAIISGVLKKNSTFSSPAVSVNAFNRATNLDDLYFTLFKPAEGEHWDGNLKKFKLEFDSNKTPFIADQFSNPAVDNTTGFFKDGITSYWTQAADSPDGGKVENGGAASRLAFPRKVYTFTGSYSDSSGVLTPSGSGSLTSAANKLDWNNAAITDAMLGGVATKPAFTYPSGGGSVVTSYREALLRWAYGYDMHDEVSTDYGGTEGEALEIRRVMGDPLHSEPGLVQYGLTAGGKPDLVAYVATNDGYLHAFNTLTGAEYFSFVPQELLPNLSKLFDDTGVYGKVYGLDGNVVTRINDLNRDGTIGAGDSVYLYIGMRRGGRDIYSLDVTDRNNPKLRWVIKGGTGDFAELGQTWSTPNIAKLRMSGSDKTVLIFGGGYSTVQDNASTRTADTVGRGVFIVDADTGALLWRADPSLAAYTEMKYSVPGRIKQIDINGDGYIDRLYLGDMGGQIWRFDIKASESSSDLATLITGGRIADLAEDGDATKARRFYYPPDVALIAEEGKAPYLSLVAVSGYRAHPLNTDTRDRAYMIRDTDVYNSPSDYSTKMVTEADLYDATLNLVGGDGADEAEKASERVALNAAKGWLISLEEIGGSFVGEKGLAEPLILDGNAIFTTYIPASSGIGNNTSCTPNDGTGIVYFVNVTDGSPTYSSTSTIGTRADRRRLLARGGIPPTPNVIVTEQGVATLCVGTECEDAKLTNTLQKSYWYEK